MSRVHVVIPTYNRRNFLMEAIQSIREQTDDGICCIVVDGGSTDGTEEYLQEQNAEWLTSIIRERAHGVSNARNVGLEAASERYVMFLDSDDHSIPVPLNT